MCQPTSITLTLFFLLNATSKLLNTAEAKEQIQGAAELDAEALAKEQIDRAVDIVAEMQLTSDQLKVPSKPVSPHLGMQKDV